VAESPSEPMKPSFPQHNCEVRSLMTEREDLPMVVDGGGEFAAASSAELGMAWLVRPDGYIGWCSTSPSVDGLQSFLKLIVQNSSAEK
jgi:hypothetical protein